MRTLDRISLIVRANLNDILDHAEDPQKMLEQIIRDMEDAVSDGKSKVAEQIAQEKLIQNDLNVAQQCADDWNNKAKLAVENGKDDLAREALSRASDYENQVAVYQKQLEQQHAAVLKMKNDLGVLENKLDEARRNKDFLINRARRAKAQTAIQHAAVQLDSTDLNSVYARMQQRVAHEEALVAATEEVNTSSVDDEFAKLEEGTHDASLESKLVALKAKVGKTS